MRKAYYADTRFSGDLDFSVRGAVDPGRFKDQVNCACERAHEASGVRFLTERTSFEAEAMIDGQRQSYKGRVYFRDFHGNEEKIIISVRLDITEFDKLLLPTVMRPLIHPYSDAEACKITMPCVVLEELLANKLKCLIQRRHSFDLYDFVYATFFEKSITIDRSLVLRTFLRKTIFEPSPGAAKDILLGLPLTLFRGAWEKYIVCPLHSRFGLDRAIEAFVAGIEEIFGSVMPGRGAQAFFPSEIRNIIFDAGLQRKLLVMTYDSRERIVEPYSLAYKRRKDGYAAEYFYGFDRTGGRSSSPGIKSFVHGNIQKIAMSDEQFEPRYEIELSKAGELPTNGYFAKPSFSRISTIRPHLRRLLDHRRSANYRVECPYCHKRFLRSTPSTTLGAHKDPNGYPCWGRRGYLV